MGSFAWAPVQNSVLGCRGYKERHVYRVAGSPQYQFHRAHDWRPTPVRVEAISQELAAKAEEDNFRFNGVQIDSTQVYGDIPVSQGTLSVHGGEREGRPRVSDSLTTPIVQTATYTFKNTAELIAYQEGRYGSYEYGRYGNPTTRTCEEKIRILEGAEDCLVSGEHLPARYRPQFPSACLYRCWLSALSSLAVIKPFQCQVFIFDLVSPHA